MLTIDVDKITRY